MPKVNIKKANMHLAKLRRLATREKSPLAEMSEEEVIKTIRKTREELWDKKLASSTSNRDSP